MSEGPEPEEIHQAVDRAVEELLDAAGVREPPVDAVALAKAHLGLVLRGDRGQAQRGRKQALPPPAPTRKSSSGSPPTRSANICKATCSAGWGLPPRTCRGLTGASLANLFADRLLTPTALAARRGAARRDTTCWR